MTNAATRSILESNRGRDPRRLRLKLDAIRGDPFAFFRGTSPLFYETLRLDRALRSSPKVLASGDLHLENFGSYKGDNRLVYFDINDFDESCVAPVAFDLVRFTTSILVAAKSLTIGKRDAMKLVHEFLETYAANTRATKPRWIERSLATGPVKELLQRVKGHHRDELIKERTSGKRGAIRITIDDKRALAITPRDRAQAESILAAYASTQPSPAFFEPLDIAARIAGNGSLGLERYVALVRGSGGDDGRYLIDIKAVMGSSLAANTDARQPRWTSEAERSASIQNIAQAIPPALLGSVGVGKRSYLIKELQPSADRLNLAGIQAKAGGKLRALNDVIRAMADVTAWGHLRGCGRYGADTVDALVDFAARSKWREQVADCAVATAALTLQQWKDYAADYDADPARLMPASIK